jgi:hypothetical protein
MILGVQGTKNFGDYSTFLHAMAVAMRRMEDQDNELLIYSAGPANINNHVAEFCNVSERGFKSRGKTIKFFRVPPSWIEKNMGKIDYVFFLGKKEDTTSRLISKAEREGVDVHVFRY